MHDSANSETASRKLVFSILKRSGVYRPAGPVYTRLTPLAENPPTLAENPGVVVYRPAGPVYTTPTRLPRIPNN